MTASPNLRNSEPAPAGASARRRRVLGALQSTPALLTLLALWLLATLGLRPLLLPDEGRYAEVARSMWRAGGLEGWLVPTLNSLPFFHKPPLFYWLDLAALQVLGATAFAGRFASALGGWLMAAALLLALRHWQAPDPRDRGAAASGGVAVLALGVLATTPFFFIGAQYANHDMLVGGLITAAVLAFARAVDDAGPGAAHPAAAAPRHAPVDRRWLVGAWALCALALLAKGLIGVVLPALVIGPWLLARGHWRQLLKLLHPLGLLTFVLLAAPWFVAMQWRYAEFFDYFFVEQHFRRFAQSNFNNVHGGWFFLVVMPLLTLPWSAWLPTMLRQQWNARRAARPISAIAPAAPAHALLGLFAWWVVAVLGFFSLPSSKLVGYALPALAPWCALLALAIDAGWRASTRRTVGVVATLAALACVGVVGAVAWQAPQSNRALAGVLAAHLAPNDRVVMVDAYLYDVPFYARLQRPVIIASDWADPALPQRDNWRKELFDAARFDPALGRELLQPLDGFERLGCGASAVWFITGSGTDAARLAAIPGARRFFADPRRALWRVPGRPCGLPGAPGFGASADPILASAH